MFYVLIFISTCSCISECTLRIMSPKYSFFYYANHLESIPAQLAMFTMICIGFTLIVTMVQLTVSLQQVLNEIHLQLAQFRNLIVQISAGFAIALYAMSLTYIIVYMDDSSQLRFMYYLWVTYYSLMSLVYFLTILILNSKMS